MCGKQKAKFEPKFKQSAEKQALTSTPGLGHLCKLLETSHSPLYLLSLSTPTPSTSSGD